MFWLCFSLSSLFGGGSTNLTSILSGDWSVTVSRAADSASESEAEQFYIYDRNNKFEITTLENETITEVEYNWLSTSHVKFTLNEEEFDMDFNGSINFDGFVNKYYIKISGRGHIVVIDTEKKTMMNLDFNKLGVQQQPWWQQYLPFLGIAGYMLVQMFLKPKMPQQPAPDPNKAQNPTPKVTEVTEDEEKAEAKEGAEAKEEGEKNEDEPKDKEDEGKVE